MLSLRIIISCGCCEDYIAKCLASVRAQQYVDWRALVTVDPCGDDTLRRALAAAEDDPRIDIHVNDVRMFSMANLIAGIRRSGAAPEDVIVVLDGDDWFYGSSALTTIVETYSRFDCWMTYGSWISNDPATHGMPSGRWPQYPEGTEDFRRATWLGTAVRTWKKWLWDLIDDSDFRDEDGAYYRVTEDRAAMLPMLEMSGTRRAKHIPDILMVYNRTTPHACGKIRYAEMLRNASCLSARPAYRRLSERPGPTGAGTLRGAARVPETGAGRDITAL